MANSKGPDQSRLHKVKVGKTIKIRRYGIKEKRGDIVKAKVTALLSNGYIVEVGCHEISVKYEEVVNG